MKRLESNMGVLMASISVTFAIFLVGIVRTDGLRFLLCGVSVILLVFTIWYYKDMQKKIDDEERKQREIEASRFKELIKTIETLKENTQNKNEKV
jgi:Na+/melibiose symporter-like transporter